MNKLKEIWSKADDVLLRYPMILTMALIAAISAITFAETTEFYYQKERVYFNISKLIIVSCLGISLMFAIKMIAQRFGKGFWLELLGSLFLIGYYFLLPKEEKDFTEVYAFLLIPTFILSHLLVAFGAFWRNGKETNFWQYNKNLFINTFLTAVFTGVLTGGVLLAILAVDHLFDINIKDFRYLQTFFFLAIFGSCFIFLLFNEKGLHSLEKDGTYPVVLKFFTQFILIPLLLVYLVILYLYSAKILINWELPRGWVSYLVLAYSVVGILALLLVHPLKEETEKSWVKAFSKIFYFTLVPLLVLLFVAIFTRILAYGYTEPRYFVLLIALWLSFVVAYFIFIKKASIKFIPISLFAFGLFALIFPYFNTFAVAKRSQKNDLIKILNEHNLLKNGKIDFNKKIKYSLVDEISSKTDFLYERKENKFINSFLDQEKQRGLDSLNQYMVKSKFRGFFKNVDYDKDKSARIYDAYVSLNATDMSFDISDYQYFIKTNINHYHKYVIDSKSLEIKTDEINDSENPKVLVIFDGKQIDILPDIEKLFDNHPHNGTFDVEQLSFSKTIKNYEFLFSFDYLSKNQEENGKKRYNLNRDGIAIFIKKVE